MKSTEIYKILNLYLKDEFKSLGYKKVKFCRLGWYKSIGNNFIIFEFQCNRWGWDYWTGTDFNFNFGCYDKITELSWSVKPIVRLNEVIQYDDLFELVEIQNSVISKFHSYDCDSKQAFPSAEPAFHDYLQNQFKPILFPPSLTDMFHMRLYDENDVHKWGIYFQKIIKFISNKLEILWN
ncbi:MAG: hypothetical protein JW943_16285 [Deltaproteobacteria bacterium]|nr:hypothetical protein [Deltaproteobacteria bacterium]